MRYSQITVLITLLLLCLISCREAIGKQHNSLPKDNTETPSQRKKLEKPVLKDTIAEPLKTPPDKELKKKKKKASDTLRPKVAVL